MSKFPFSLNQERKHFGIFFSPYHVLSKIIRHVALVTSAVSFLLHFYETIIIFAAAKSGKR
jgi:hypothetical protein